MNENSIKNKYSSIIEKDLEMVIDMAVEHAMRRMTVKYPKEKEFDLIARDFTTVLTIKIASNDPTVILSNNSSYSWGRVEELYVGDAVSAVTADNHKNKHYDLSKCNFLLEMLRDVSLISELDMYVGYDNFVKWANNKNHDEFYSILEKNHPELFSVFGYKPTVKMLNPIVQSVIERAYRSDVIQQDYIDKAQGIKEKVKSVFKWYEQKSVKWWDEEVKSWFPEFKSQKHRRITCVEIVPKSSKKDSAIIGDKIRTNRMYDLGKIGGKVIKISDDYNDMREEFSNSQVNTFFSKPEYLNGDISKFRLDSLRLQSFLEHCDRCYVAPQMIDNYLEIMKQIYNPKSIKKQMDVITDEMKKDRLFRNISYKFVFASATVQGNLHYT